MAAMIQLTHKLGKLSDDGPRREPGPVWINAFGVNSVEASSGGGAWVRMDDGTGYLVSEDPEYVVLAIDEQSKESYA